MAVFFAANAFWWAYRAGATISRAYLNWEAGRRGTTLEAAFESARFRASRGQLSGDQVLLLRFVESNNRWAWTDSQSFALDTSAFATAGLGLLAKVGLGNRILTVLGIKHAPTAGVIIDGMIDAVGSMLTGGEGRLPGVGDTLKAALEVLRGVQQTDLVKHGTAVVTATVKLGSLIQPFLGAPVSPLRAVAAIPAIINAGAKLFGAILGLWGVVEPLLPEPKPKPATGMRGDPPLTDPVFRNALAEIEEEPPAPPPPPPADPVDVILPDRVGRKIGGIGVTIFPDGDPAIDSRDRTAFVRMFSNSFGGTGGSLRALKEDRAGTIFPFG